MGPKTRIAVLSLAGAAALSACHVGGGYTVGGTVVGLRGTGLVLQDNSGDSLTVTANGSFQFSSGIDQGGTYSVTVSSQPTATPAQTCVVHNASGTIGTANIINVVVSCSRPGAFVYAVNQSASTISAWSIDTNGTLTSIATYQSTGNDPVAAVVDPNGTYLYVANFGSNTVSIYAIDPTTGVLTSPGEPIATGNGPFALLVDPADQFLYVANRTDNTVSVFEIESDGTAAAVSGSPYAVGTEPTSIATDPGGNFLYVTNYGQANVSAFSIEAGAGQLTPLGSSPFGADTGSLAMAIDPTGTLAYVANETADTLSGFALNASTGALTPLSGFPFSTGSSPEAVAVDPSGRFLLVANVTAANDVSSYSITPSSGALTLAASVSSGTFPLDIKFTPTGAFAYVANENSDTVTGFAFDATTGALTPVPGSPFLAGTAPHGLAVD